MSAWRMAGAVAGVAALWLGALAAWLASATGTCTQGDAGQLLLGVPALALFALGFWLLWAARPAWWALGLALVPAVPFYAPAAWLGLRLAAGILLDGASSCEVLTSLPHEASGEERFHVALWLLVALVPPLGVAAVLRRGQP